MHLPALSQEDAQALKRLKAMTFPNTHIEAIREDGQYHVYSEGEWQACYAEIADTIRDVADRLAGRTSITNGENGEYDEAPPRLYPNWPKWPQVRMGAAG